MLWVPKLLNEIAHSYRASLVTKIKIGASLILYLCIYFIVQGTRTTLFILGFNKLQIRGSGVIHWLLQVFDSFSFR